MASRGEPTAQKASAARERFEAEERALWSSYGLDARVRWIELEEPRVRLRVQEIGSGDPVLYIGGSGGTGAYFAPLVREIPGRRSIVFDRPGWGLSSPIDYRGLDYGDITARLVAGILDQLDLDRPDVVGVSIGAIWGLQAAHRHPNRVGRLALIGGMPNPEVPLPTFIKLLRSPIGALMVRVPMRPRILRRQLEALGHGPTLGRGGMQDYVAWRLAFQNGTQSLRHERDMVRAITIADGFRPGVTLGGDVLATISQPVLMVFGEADPTGTVEVWRHFVDRLPSGRFHIVPAAGHNAFWDQPTVVGELVRTFLSRAADASGRTRRS